MHQTEEIKASVVQAIEEHDIRGGVITIDFLNNRLKEHHKQLVNRCFVISFNKVE